MDGWIVDAITSYIRVSCPGDAARHAAERHLQRAPAVDPRQCAWASPTWLTCTWPPLAPLHPLVSLFHPATCVDVPPPPLGALEWALPGALTHDSTPPLALPGGRIHGRPRDGGEHLAALEEQLPQLVHSALSWRPLDALSPRSATARHSSPFLPLAAERALWGALHALGTTW